MYEFQQSMYNLVLLLSTSITIYALYQQAPENVVYLKINSPWDLTSNGLVNDVSR